MVAESVRKTVMEEAVREKKARRLFSMERGKTYAQRAGALCASANFRLYLDERARAKFGADVPDGTHSEEDAADWIRRAVGVASRADIDGSVDAVRRYVAIRSRFLLWEKRRGLS